jgi:hypothetical protein
MPCHACWGYPCPGRSKPCLGLSLPLLLGILRQRGSGYIWRGPWAEPRAAELVVPDCERGPLAYAAHDQRQGSVPIGVQWHLGVIACRQQAAAQIEDRGVTGAGMPCCGAAPCPHYLCPDDLADGNPGLYRGTLLHNLS